MAMYRRLDPEPGLLTGVWIPSRGYVYAFGFPNAAIEYTKVFGYAHPKTCLQNLGPGTSHLKIGREGSLCMKYIWLRLDS